MLEGIRNFRDAGGYAAGRGALRRNMLFRSGRLTEATVDDEAVLAGLDIRTIVDLRRPSERLEHPTGQWAGACTAITSNAGGHDDPWPAFLRSATPTAAAVQVYIQQFYRDMPFEPQHVDLFTRYFSALADGEGSILVHCTGGKDRTGFAVALTHRLLGVSHADMVADYMLTNRNWTVKTHIEEVARAMTLIAGTTVDIPTARAAVEVETGFLDMAFGAIDARMGSLTDYLQDVLGVTAEKQRRIVARLIAETAG